MLNKNFILHLSLIEGIGPITTKAIIEKKPDATISDLYLFSATDWMHYYGVKEVAAQKLAAGLADQKILETELQLIERYQINWVTILSDLYPALLRAIYMPPTVLYWKGGNFNAEQKHVAIVGSRAANAYGHTIVTTVVPELVSADIVIVSGGALGIDTLAHDCALKNGGKTIAVLGSGLLQEYPPSNKKLFKSIIDNNGLLVSAFPLLMEPLPGNFPARNRIISGLSHGCLVVQAAQKSGALITAHYALEQGREVFAIPGSLDDPLSAGCHALIQQGAKLVTCPADIITEIGGHYPVKRDMQITIHDAQQLAQHTLPQNVPKIQSNLPVAQQKIMLACKQQPSSLDDIMYATNLDIATVQSELFTMQLDGLVEQDFTGMWTTT